MLRAFHWMPEKAKIRAQMEADRAERASASQSIAQ